MKRFLLTLALLSTGVVPVAAQDACLSLLRHGMYDKFREHSVSASAAQISSHLCQAYAKLQQDKTAKRPEPAYPLPGDLGTLSRVQLEPMGKLLCTQSYTATSASHELSAWQNRLSQAGVDTFKECVQGYAAGLRTVTTFREEDQGQLTLEVTYVPPAEAQSSTTLRHIVVSPAQAFKCTGSLWDLWTTGGRFDPNRKYALSCEREVKIAPVTQGGRSLYAPASTLTVMTDAGTITRTMAEKLAGPPPASPTPAPPPTPPQPAVTLPVGTVIAFAGTLQDAEALKSSGWWVCDGRTVDDAAAQRFHGKATPNLTDRFLFGARRAGETGGSTSSKVGDQVIDSVAVGWGNAVVFKDPRLIIADMQQPRQGWPIASQGFLRGFEVPTMPPFYAVIYLVKVK